MLGRCDVAAVGVEQGTAAIEPGRHVRFGMAGDPPRERRRRVVQPALALVDLGQVGVSLVQVRLEPDGLLEVGHCLVEPLRLKPHQAAIGQENVSKIVVVFKGEGLTVILLRGGDRLGRFVPEPEASASSLGRTWSSFTRAWLPSSPATRARIRYRPTRSGWLRMHVFRLALAWLNPFGWMLR